MVGNGLCRIWRNWVSFRGKIPLSGVRECPWHLTEVLAQSSLRTKCHDWRELEFSDLAGGNYFAQTRIYLDFFFFRFFILSHFSLQAGFASLSEPFFVFSFAKGEKKNPSVLWGSNFLLAAPCHEPDCTAEILLISCRSLN